MQTRRVAGDRAPAAPVLLSEPLRASETEAWKEAPRYVPGKTNNKTAASAKARCGLGCGQRGPGRGSGLRAAQGRAAGTAPVRERACAFLPEDSRKA